MRVRGKGGSKAENAEGAKGQREHGWEMREGEGLYSLYV